MCSNLSESLGFGGERGVIYFSVAHIRMDFSLKFLRGMSVCNPETSPVLCRSRVSVPLAHASWHCPRGVGCCGRTRHRDLEAELTVGVTQGISVLFPAWCLQEPTCVPWGAGFGLPWAAHSPQ